MNNLCKEIKKSLQPLENARLEMEYKYSAYTKREWVNVYIGSQKGEEWYFCIHKNIGEKTFDISFSPYINRKTIDENKKEILFYYKAFMHAFETWIKTQREIRLQYMFHRDSVVDESVTISYLKLLQKDLA